MLWAEEEAEVDKDTEVIEELADVAEDSSSEDTEADEKDPDSNDDGFGESRYARKSRHLPHLEDGPESQSGSGLRNAIIGVTKRGGSS
jgi:hypothetical protein